ncbi:hypothetical protein ABPG77_001607 [Micractinium sp. CCAP 211/92]
MGRQRRGLRRRQRQRQQRVRRSRRLVARLFADDQQGQQQEEDSEEEEEEAPARSRHRRRAACARGEPSGSSEGEGLEGSSDDEDQWEGGSGVDPASSVSDGSGAWDVPASRPRLHPRIGVDCWARAFVYGSTFRYPARLDAMLMWCTRDYLRSTPEARQPGDVAGLAAAVVLRYGRQLWRHYASFRYTLNSFNLLQNKRSNKTAGDMHVVKELQGRLYCEDIPLTEEEQQEGVDAADELEAWAAMCWERQAAAPGIGSANTAAGGLQLLLTDAYDREEDEEEERDREGV